MPRYQFALKLPLLHFGEISLILGISFFNCLLVQLVALISEKKACKQKGIAYCFNKLGKA